MTEMINHAFVFRAPFNSSDDELSWATKSLGRIAASRTATRAAHAQPPPTPYTASRKAISRARLYILEQCHIRDIATLRKVR